MKQLQKVHTKWRDKLTGSKTYFKILFAITGSTLTVVLLLSGILYGGTRKMLTEQSILLSTQSFAQIQSVADTMKTTANSVATQVLLEDNSGKILLAVNEKSADAMAVYGAVRQMTLLQNVNSSIDSIYLYNAAADTLVTTEPKALYMGTDKFYDAALIERLRDYEHGSDRTLYRRTVERTGANSLVQSRDVYTYIVPYMFDGDKLKSAVVVNISADWLAQQLVETQQLADSMILVLDGANPQPFIELNGLGSKVEFADFATAIGTIREQGEAYTQCEHGGEKYFASCLYSQKLGWHFVKITKWSTVFSALEQLRCGALLLVVCIVALCLVLSLLGAGSLYKLYHAVEGNYNKLVRHRRTQTDRMRESFLSDYLSGAKLFSPLQLQARLEEHELSLCDAPVHTVVLLRVGHYAQMKEEYSDAGMYSIKYGIRNIFEELCEPYFAAAGMLGRDNCLVFVLSPRRGALHAQEVQLAFHQFCERVQVFVPSTYNLIGTAETVAPSGLPGLYQKVEAIADEAFFYPDNAYLDYAEVRASHSAAIDARALDHHILPALLGGGTQEAVRQYEEFAAAVQPCCYADYLNVLIWLGFSVVRTVSEMQSGSSQSGRSYFGDFLLRMLACEKKPDMDALFYEMFDKTQLALEQANAKTGAWGKLEDIQSYVEQHYTDANLSLESVADTFDISASYLGKIFRKAASMSLAEYINQVRLEHVMSQMAATNRSVKDIAADCGFSGANYFYTYFKKKYGLTPQAYRERLKQNRAEND